MLITSSRQGKHEVGDIFGILRILRMVRTAGCWLLHSAGDFMNILTD